MRRYWGEEPDLVDHCQSRERSRMNPKHPLDTLGMLQYTAPSYEVTSDYVCMHMAALRACRWTQSLKRSSDLLGL